MTEGKRSIRVAQVLGMAMNGGVEACIMNYYRHIDHSRVQFDFFVEDVSKIVRRDKIEEMGGKVIIIPSYKNPFKYIKVLKKLFKEGDYDIVHSNMNTLSVFSLYAAKKAGIKIRIAHSHSTSNKKEWKKNIIKNMLRPFSKIYATHYFACSELAGRWLFGNKTFEQGKITIINNAIELERFKFNPETRKELREELGLEKNLVIGHIGRFVSQKNHTFLIDIFNEVQKRRPEARLLLLGDGPLYDEILKKTDELGLKEKVIFEGVHKHPERYYQAMDCFVLPSLYEGLGIVCVEAQVSGLQCFVSTEVPREVSVGAVEFISLEKTAREWAQEVQDMIIQSEASIMGEKEERKKAYRRFNGSLYDITIEAQKLLGYYEDMLEENKIYEVV